MKEESFFSKRWQQVSRLGVHDSLPRGLRKRIILTNQIALLLAVVALGFMIPWGLKQNFLMTLTNGMIACLYLVIPMANMYHRYNFSRLFVIFLISTFIFVFVGSVGKVSDIHIVFFPAAGFSILLFDPREKIKLYLGIFFPVGLFTYLALNNFKVFPNYIGEIIPGLSEFNYLATFLLVICSMMWLYRSTEEVENEYKKLYEEHVQSQRLLDEERSKAIYAAKMAALGEMASGMAHEINSPLSIITFLSEQLMRNLKKHSVVDEKSQNSAAKIHHTAHRIAKIINALRTFSRSSKDMPLQDVDAVQLVEETLLLCHERYKLQQIQLSFNADADLPVVLCRPIEVGQVLINLLNNAFDAVSSSGVGQEVRVRCFSENGKVCITISDDGPGVSPELRDKIFLPFFTTKEIGKGTGLGLSISKGMMEANGGRLILCPSERGALFKVELITKESRS